MIARLSDNQSKFIIDFEIQVDHGLIVKTKHWEWRQFILDGDMLYIHDSRTKKQLYKFRIDSCTFMYNEAKHTCTLLVQGFKILMRCPSQTLWRKFNTVFETAKKFTHWSVPHYDEHTNLLNVARSILETNASFPLDILNAKVTVQDVQAHLAEMKGIYDIIGECQSLNELYEILLDYEEDYASNPTVNNFAHTVHKLHPRLYSYHLKNPGTRVSIKNFLGQCRRQDCQNKLSLTEMFEMHILDIAILCQQCKSNLSCGIYQLESWLKTPRKVFLSTELLSRPIDLEITLPLLTRTNTMSEFETEVTRLTKHECEKTSTDGAKDFRRLVNSEIQNIVKSHLGSFNLDLVHGMLRQLDFINKICANYSYWNDPIVIQASIIRYNQFMHLTKVKQHNQMLVPTSDIDLVWHTHQTQHEGYRQFCYALTGGMVDHDDTVLGGVLQVGYKCTFELWAEHFNTPYSSYPTAQHSITEMPKKRRNILASLNKLTEKSAADLGRLPSHDCRFYGVNESSQTLPLGFHVEKGVPIEKEASIAPLVYLTVIGTPVMDSRVRVAETRQEKLLKTLRSKSSQTPENIAIGCGYGGCNCQSAWGRPGGCTSAGGCSIAASGGYGDAGTSEGGGGCGDGDGGGGCGGCGGD